MSVRMSGASNKVVERVGVLTGDWNCRIVRGPGRTGPPCS